MHLSDDELVNGLSGHEEGAELQAAVYARVTTAVSFTRTLGNYLIARPAARAAAHEMTEQTGVPLDAAVVLGLSSHALHVWAADPMLNQVGDYLGKVPLGRINAMSATPGRSWQKLAIMLDGGQRIDLEARGASHALVAAFDQMKGAAAQS
jgi:hypothetical protein